MNDLLGRNKHYGGAKTDVLVISNQGYRFVFKGGLDILNISGMRPLNLIVFLGDDR